MEISLNATIINPPNSFFSTSLVKLSASPQMRECLSVTTAGPENAFHFGLLNFRFSIHDSEECRHASIGPEKITLTFQIDQNRNISHANFASIDFTLEVIPTPERSKWILFDQYHSLKYPESGYILRDSVFQDQHPFEWKGDHLYTNYAQLLKYLWEKGFYPEILTEPLTCFDSWNYGTFILADPERRLSQNEILKVRADVENWGMDLIVFAEWSHPVLSEKHAFKSYTGKMWTPSVG